MEISPEMIGRLVAYQTAMAEYKKAVDETLAANEAAITPIAERYYGTYDLYVINYAVLALQEPESGDDDDYDFDFGEKGVRKATVDRYDGYAFSDTPDERGYYLCIDGNSRWHQDLVQVKFHQISKIEKRRIEIGNGKDGQWIFPCVEVPYANVSKFGNGRVASIYYDPRQTNRKALKAEIDAVVKPMPEMPKYESFGITDAEYRALRALSQ